MKPSFNALSQKALIAVVVALLPLPISFLLSYESSEKHLRARILDDLSAVTEAYEGQVFQFLERARIRAADFASDGYVRDELETAGGGRRLSDHLRKNKKPLDHSIRNIIIADAEGRIAASTNAVVVGKIIAGTPAFEQGRRGTAVVDDGGRILVSAPVLSRTSERLLGVLMNEIPLSELDRVLSGLFSREQGALTWNSGRPRTMEAYVVNRERRMLTTPDANVGRGAEPRLVVDTPPAQECIGAGREMRGFYRDYRGTEVAGASMCMPSLQWVLIVEAESSEVLGPPLREMQRNAIVAAVLAAGFLGIFFALFFRNVITPLRRMAAAAKEIAGGAFTTVIPVQSGDEIGVLSQAFNDMARQIDSRTALLRESEASLANAQRIARLGNWDWDIVKNELRWSDEVYRIFGVAAGEFGATFEAFLQYVHPGDRAFVSSSIEDALAGMPCDIDHRIVRLDGAVRTVHERAEVIVDGAGRPVRMTGTVQDITDLKEAEEELHILSAAIEHSVNVVFITDRQGAIEYVNPTFETVTGWPRGEAIGKTPSILASGETTRAEYQELWNTIITGKTWRGAFKNKKKDGRPYWGNTVITPIRNVRGEISHFLAVQEDITERKQSEERIKYLASFDELTGLMNRARFIDVLEEWIHALERAGGGAGGLLLIDIDELKFINDTHGHAMGDEFIRRTGGLLQRTLRDMAPSLKEVGGILLGRMGADEFAAFLPNLGEQDSLDAAERLRRAVEGFQLMEGAAHVTVSIGVALHPEHGLTVKELFTKADVALYRSKRMGKNRVRLYRSEDRELEYIHSRYRQKERIQTAIVEDRFLPWFQPILDIRNGTVSHYEALARLKNGDGSILQPGDFIETAEIFGMIGAIDRIIMEKTMRLQAATAREGRDLAFSMNLSGKELGDEDALSYLKEKIKETGADPSRLIFEITETAAVHDLERAIRFVNALRALGCRFSLDDFGVGFTSFIYLREMGVDYVKIDGSFIRNIRESKNDQLFVKAITDVARGMEIRTVAEFVESRESLDLLRKFGVDYAQGYFIGRPSPELLLPGKENKK